MTNKRSTILYDNPRQSLNIEHLFVYSVIIHI